MGNGWKVLIPFLVFFVVFATHYAGPKIPVGDSRWVFPVALSILREGNTDLDEYRDRLTIEPKYNIIEVDGHLYNLFPLGPSLVVLPLAYFRILHSDDFPNEFDYYKHRNFSRRQREAASLLVALASVFMYLISRCSRMSIPLSLLAVFIFAYCTSTWSSTSRVMWQHGPSVLMQSIALYFLVAGRTKNRLIPLSGLFLSLAYLMRPTNALPIFVFGIYVVIRHRRQFIPWILCALPAAVFFISCNLSIYGSLFPPYYLGSKLQGNHFWEALAGTLISPNRGLLIFTPVLLLSFLGVGIRVRIRTLSPLDGALIAVILLHWIVCSRYDHWWCGYSYGPRFFADTIPYFVYLLLPALGYLKWNQGARKACLASFAAVLILFSFFVHFRGAHHLSTLDWNTRPVSVDQAPERIWDWGDMQFLRTSESHDAPLDRESD